MNMSRSISPEEEQARRAKRVEELFLGKDPYRIFLDSAPNTVEAILKYTTDRIEQALNMLIELDFAKQPDWAMFAYIPDEDRRKHLAEKVIEGLKAYDAHYGKYERFGFNKKLWNNQNRVRL